MSQNDSTNDENHVIVDSKYLKLSTTRYHSTLLFRQNRLTKSYNQEVDEYYFVNECLVSSKLT